MNDGEKPQPPVTEQVPEHRWLSIRAASALLGVDKTTLRRWSDAGKLPVFLTPGGHRRYAEADVRALAQGATGSRPMTSDALTRASLSRYRHEGYVTEVRRRSWYGDYDAEGVEAHRTRGFAMVALAVRYIAAARDDRPAILDDACAVAADYGRDSARHGLGIADAVQIYLRARTPILNGVMQFLASGATTTARTGRVFTDVSAFMDQTLVAMIAQYERDLHDDTGAANTGKHDPTIDDASFSP